MFGSHSASSRLVHFKEPWRGYSREVPPDTALRLSTRLSIQESDAFEQSPGCWMWSNAQSGRGGSFGQESMCMRSSLTSRHVLAHAVVPAAPRPQSGGGFMPCRYGHAAVDQIRALALFSPTVDGFDCSNSGSDLQVETCRLRPSRTLILCCDAPRKEA